MPHMQEEQRQTARLDTPPRGMSTLFLLIHPLPPDPHPRYYCYELSTELSPALYLSSAIGPLQARASTGVRPSSGQVRKVIFRERPDRHPRSG
jgi:hypothetical protein